MGEPVRLQKLLAQAGFGSRRSCETYIVEGRVTVDGVVVRQLGSKADPETQTVEFDGQKAAGPGKRSKGVRDAGEKVYYVLNKPRGVLCTNEDPAGRPLAVQLVDEKRRIYCVGRLDSDTEGLIILTNDGDLTNQLTHPRYGVEKTYIARVDGRVSPVQIKKLEDGVHLAEGRTHGARVRVRRVGENASTVEMTISEGMNRQVRRMLARVGLRCRLLRRVAIGPIRVQEMPVGAHRRLSPEELNRLRAAIGVAQRDAGVAGESGRVEPETDRAKKHARRPAEALEAGDDWDTELDETAAAKFSKHAQPAQPVDAAEVSAAADDTDDDDEAALDDLEEKADAVETAGAGESEADAKKEAVDALAKDSDKDDGELEADEAAAKPPVSAAETRDRGAESDPELSDDDLEDELEDATEVTADAATIEDLTDDEELESSDGEEEDADEKDNEEFAKPKPRRDESHRSRDRGPNAAPTFSETPEAPEAFWKKRGKGKPEDRERKGYAQSNPRDRGDRGDRGDRRDRGERSGQRERSGPSERYGQGSRGGAGGRSAQSERSGRGGAYDPRQRGDRARPSYAPGGDRAREGSQQRYGDKRGSAQGRDRGDRPWQRDDRARQGSGGSRGYSGGKPAYGDKSRYSGGKPGYGGDKPRYAGSKPGYAGGKPGFKKPWQDRGERPQYDRAARPGQDRGERPQQDRAARPWQDRPRGGESRGYAGKRDGAQRGYAGKPSGDRGGYAGKRGGENRGYAGKSGGGSGGYAPKPRPAYEPRGDRPRDDRRESAGGGPEQHRYSRPWEKRDRPQSDRGDRGDRGSSSGPSRERGEYRPKKNYADRSSGRPQDRRDSRPSSSGGGGFKKPWEKRGNDRGERRDRPDHRRESGSRPAGDSARPKTRPWEK